MSVYNKMRLTAVNEQNDRPFLHVCGLVTRRSEDPPVDSVLRALEPEVLARV